MYFWLLCIEAGQIVLSYLALGSCEYYVVMVPVQEIGVKVVPPVLKFGLFERHLRYVPFSFRLPLIPKPTPYQEFLQGLSIIRHVIREVVLKLLTG